MYRFFKLTINQKPKSNKVKKSKEYNSQRNEYKWIYNEYKLTNLTSPAYNSLSDFSKCNNKCQQYRKTLKTKQFKDVIQSQFYQVQICHNLLCGIKKNGYSLELKVKSK